MLVMLSAELWLSWSELASG